MLVAERRQVILERLHATSRVVVAELSAEFGVSEETIRRDLEWLEKEGVATRTYGGAVLKNNDRVPPPYAVRKNTNVEGKVAIAQLLVPMIHEGDAIMVDESSTAAYAIRALRHLRSITLITNSQEMIQEMGRQESWQIISTGGHLKCDVMALVGPQAVRSIENYHVRWAILSCRGINGRLGIADSSEDIVQVKRAMMRSADDTILLADHRKFDRTGFVALGRLDEVDYLVTDQAPSEEWCLDLEQKKVQLIFQ